MAVWQYNVFFIPFINFDENYLEFIKQPDTEFLKNTECFWNNSFINKNEIELRIDNFISYYKIVENDSIYWKGYTSDFEDNDCSIVFDYEKNINYFNFRFDLRNEINIIKSIDLITKIAKEYQLILMNTNYIFFEAETDLLKNEIRNSNGFKFLENPENFFDHL